jgi:hypothetical protein
VVGRESHSVVLPLPLSLSLPLTLCRQEASDTSFGVGRPQRKGAKGASPTSDVNREMAAGFAC